MNTREKSTKELMGELLELIEKMNSYDLRCHAMALYTAICNLFGFDAVVKLAEKVDEMRREFNRLNPADDVPPSAPAPAPAKTH